jgi:hypothetical protein
VSISAANNGTVTLGNSSGNVNLISSDGNATVYGKGTINQTDSNATGDYDYFGSNLFNIPFDTVPIVIVSMYANPESAIPLPPPGTTIVATNISGTGFKVYSDQMGTAYNWIASAITV